MTSAIRATIGLPPEDTVRAFEARDTLRTTVRWSDMWQEEHARAFTVARVANLDLLAEIQASLADMLANGGTFDQWKDGLVPFLQRQGWWGDVADRELTGTDDVVRVDARRLRTIYDTNLRVSRAAGRWKRIQELKDARPFLRYTAVMDGRTRPEHRQFHGTILPVDHPWWDTHFPPCGWYCRCTVRQLSQRELDAKGWSVTADPPGAGTLPFVRADGTIVQVPSGIAPGWAYNPGKAGLDAILSRASRSIERVAAFDTEAARDAVAQLVKGEPFSEFLKDRGGAFPVAVLDAGGVEMLRAKSPVVVVPSGVLRKQDRRHGEVTVADYRQLPGILHDPLVIVDEPSSDPRIKGRVVFYAARLDGRARYYRVVIRSDRDEPRSAVVSFHMTRPRDIAATIRRGRLLLDRREEP